MKITIDIDCTPQEARAFLGLPNIEPMQDALVAQMQARLAESMSAMEPDALMRLWFPGGLQGLGQIQEILESVSSRRSGGGRAWQGPEEGMRISTA